MQAGMVLMSSGALVASSATAVSASAFNETVGVERDAVVERGSVVGDGYTLEWSPIGEQALAGRRDASPYNSMDGGQSTAYTVGDFTSPALLRDDYAFEGATGAEQAYTRFRFFGGVALANMVLESRWRDPSTNLMGTHVVRFPQAGNFEYTITFDQPLTMADQGFFEIRSGSPQQNGASSWSRFTWVSAAAAPSAGANTGAPGVGDGSTTGTIWSFAFEVLTPCPADLNVSGDVSGADLGLLLGQWGQTGTLADLNGNGVVDGADLGLLLGAWGQCP